MMDGAVPPVVVIEQRGRGTVFVLCGIVAAVAAAVVLYSFNPSESRFYPRCFFRLVTGWDCPGCGGLRATHQLLHGHVREAFRLNPLFVVALPGIAYFAARHLFQLLSGRRSSPPFKTTVWVWAGGLVVVAFGVLRNLPWRAWFNG